MKRFTCRAKGPRVRHVVYEGGRRKTLYRRLEKTLKSELVEKKNPDVTPSSSSMQTDIAIEQQQEIIAKILFLKWVGSLFFDAETAEEIEEIVEQKSFISKTSSTDNLDTCTEDEKCDIKPKKQNVVKRKTTDIGARSKKKTRTNLPGLWEFKSITGMDIRNGKKYFHVKWNKDETTWEPEKNVPAEHIADFINSSIHASV